jgi:uncharacterized protein involved in exopolysaccharide biosynthesis
MTSPPAGHDGELSLFSELNVLLRRWRVLVMVPLVFGLVAVLITLALGRDYVAESRFAPQSSASLARVSGIAAQFGLTVGGVGPSSESLEFYTELLQSRELLAAAALSSYRFSTRPGGSDSLAGSLVELYRIRNKTREATLLAAVERLRNDVTTSTGLRRAGIVTLTTRTPWRDLSVQINRRLLHLVNEFNLRQRQSQASAERRFVEGRLTEARESLVVAENSLARFLEQNRQYQASPRLLFESQRLQRRVDLAQEVHLTLARAVEEARIEEVRNTPVITVLDGPEGSARRAQSLRLIAMLGVTIGFVAGMVMVFVLEYSERDRARHPTAYEEFVRLATALARTLMLRRSGERS